MNHKKPNSPPTTFYWEWCESCGVTLTSSCACANACNGSRCSECEAVKNIADKQIEAGTAPKREDCPMPMFEAVDENGLI